MKINSFLNRQNRYDKKYQSNHESLKKKLENQFSKNSDQITDESYTFQPKLILSKSTNIAEYKRHSVIYY